MVEQGGGLALDLEPLPLAGVEGRGAGQDLQRHATAQGELLGLVDDAHPAAADLADDPEVAEQGGGGHALGRGPLAGRRRDFIGRRPDELQAIDALGEHAGDFAMAFEEFPALR